MASKVVVIGLVLVLVVTILSMGAISQSDCTSVILSLAPCLDYVTGSSPKPTGSCCPALANVVQTNPVCLCEVINGGAQLPIKINTTRALSLPSACNVKTPPVSKCNRAPSSAPEGSSTNSSSGTGSKATPGIGTPSNASTVTNQLVVGFLVVMVVSKFSFI